MGAPVPYPIQEQMFFLEPNYGHAGLHRLPGRNRVRGHDATRLPNMRTGGIAGPAEERGHNDTQGRHRPGGDERDGILRLKGAEKGL